MFIKLTDLKKNYFNDNLIKKSEVRNKVNRKLILWTDNKVYLRKKINYIKILKIN